MATATELPPPREIPKYRMDFTLDEAIVLVDALQKKVKQSEADGVEPTCSKAMYESLRRVVYNR